MSGPLFGGMVAGFGQAAAKRNQDLLDQEIERREGLVSLYKELYESPNIPPEMKQKFLQYMIEIPQIPYDKKLPKQYTDMSSILAERQQLQGPMAPPSTAIGAAPPPPPPPAPGGLIGSATGEAREAGIPYTPPGAGFEAPPPGAAAPGPAPSLEYTPEELQILRDLEARGAAATAINVAQQYQRAKLPPPDVTFPRPVPVSPGGALAPLDPATGQPTGEMIPGPPAIGAAEGPGTFNSYARAALLAAGFDPNNPAERPGDRNAVVQAARREWEKPTAGVFLPLMNAFGEITGFYNAETGESTGPPPSEALAPGQRTGPRAAPGQPPIPGEPPIPGADPATPQEVPEAGQAGPAARRSGVTLAERDKKAAMEVMLQDVDRLRYYADLHPEAIGPFMGRVYNMGRELVDVAPGINKMFRITTNLAELLLRARSGAQINEAEYRRLRRLMPDPRNPDGKFWVDLSEYYLESRRIFEAKFGRVYIPLEILEDGSIWEVDARGNRTYLEGGPGPPGGE